MKRTLVFENGGNKGHEAEKQVIGGMAPGDCVCFVYGDEDRAGRKLRSLRKTVARGRRLFVWLLQEGV